MTKEFEDRGNTYTIHESKDIGEVRVADEVVAIIAGLAATEVDGVESMAGNITNELVSKLGMKNLSKGVKVHVGEQDVVVNLALNIKYGCENMTGLEVSIVNVRIASVDMGNNK